MGRILAALASAARRAEAYGSFISAAYAPAVRAPAAVLAVALLAVLALAPGDTVSQGAQAAGGAAEGRSAAEVFGGLATWVDVFDGPVYADPEGTAARIAARGVRTVFAETANFKATSDVVGADALARFVDALHGRGIAVVAWYLPGFDKPARDLRRTRAMLAFRTASGGAFDGVALDVESTVERRVAVRSLRLLNLARTLRAEAGEKPVAAITLPPRMLERRPTVWPRFPWASLAGLVDAFVPMTYTGTAFRGYEATYGYVARSLAALRTQLVAAGLETPVHAAGGVADRMSADELRAFVDAAADAGVTGVSLYDFHTTLTRGWVALAAFGA